MAFSHLQNNITGRRDGSTIQRVTNICIARGHFSQIVRKANICEREIGGYNRMGKAMKSLNFKEKKKKAFIVNCIIQSLKTKLLMPIRYLIGTDNTSKVEFRTKGTTYKHAYDNTLCTGTIKSENGHIKAANIDLKFYKLTDILRKPSQRMPRLEKSIWVEYFFSILTRILNTTTRIPRYYILNIVQKYFYLKSY